MTKQARSREQSQGLCSVRDFSHSAVRSPTGAKQGRAEVATGRRCERVEALSREQRLLAKGPLADDLFPTPAPTDMVVPAVVLQEIARSAMSALDASVRAFSVQME